MDFKSEALEILNRNDYDFKAKEIALFVIFKQSGENEIFTQTKRNFTHKEDISLSLLKARLSHTINKFIESNRLCYHKERSDKVDCHALSSDKSRNDIDSINADFFIAFDESIKDIEQEIATIESIESKQDSKIESNLQIKQLNPVKENKIKLDLLPQEPKYNLNQITLDKKTKKELLNCATLVKKQGLIYDEWGFKEIDSTTKTIINFYGKPGTGKTMSAHILASELNKKIILSNYADIESKYVGDAPKNLVAAFDLAQQSDAILFFDEADSFLGKRITNVTQSADQAINSLRSELLKLLEERSVIVIFATNLMENYDNAFNSRILRSIEFKLPSKKQRKKMIKSLIPSKLYDKGVNLDENEIEILVALSDGLSGREIKNAILNTLINVASIESNVDSIEIIPTFKDFKKAFKSINKSRGINIIKRKNNAKIARNI
ncbi:AAA family ATPase [Helicobacter saguini]|uniref:AAA family ATPase n=2 Tax=Helicobacter saguini TaxID=1548018 RepID=A0A347VMS1_9HELI|nr:AAA family ATPase [Helicobacter saguini]MWV67753.1 AAA family ATPase [Helicobacter saguini]MWV70779.1 AAA family ATPase [Helicobacter saguini]MWV72683.1 AAA family ATPase [Helicobacter saguini]TLD94609.1 AAA family ATPase [Helicobacter saguini]